MEVQRTPAPVGGAGPAATSAPAAATTSNSASASLSTPAPSAAAGASASASSSGPAPTVYLATYSSVPVYEITVRGIACMRRRSDGFLNATQILKIAGVEKARRTKILEKEILTGEHEKVQGGYGKYQGTWIPLRRAQELSATYSVSHLLKPLLEFDPSTASSVPLAGPRKRPNPNAPSASMFYRQGPGAAQLAAAKAATASPGPSGTSIVVGSPSGAPGAGPSQQPRFLSLRPPPASAAGAEADSLLASLVGSNFAPAGAEPGIPAGSNASQREALTNYSSLGYTPQGVPLPPKRPAEDGGEPDTKRSRVASGGALTDKSGALNGAQSQSQTTPIGLSPVKDLNALGRTSPSSALRGARAPARASRAVLGPPDNLRSEIGGSRFSDRPQLPREGDEGERRMRERLTSLFIDASVASGSASSADKEGAEASNSISSGLAPLRLVGKDDVAKLDSLLGALKHAVSLAGGAITAAVAGTTASPNGVPASASTASTTSGPTACVDLVIDDHGHTALHWASALARLPLVRLLLARPQVQGGANPHAGNHAGETALHRSVLVTNSYDSSSFPQLLALLRESLHTRDFKRRTILHHIAHVSALKGRAGSARYYLACVLDHISKHEGGRYSQLVDAQDEDGDTALGIVARIGNASMIRMLLDVGARKDLPNQLGIRPMDWGIDGAGAENDENAGGSAAAELAKERPQDMVTALKKAPKAPLQKSKDIQEQLGGVLKELSDVFEREMSEKEAALGVAQAHLQSATRELAGRRRKVAEAQKVAGERNETRMRNANLARLLREEMGGEEAATAEGEADDEALSKHVKELLEWRSKHGAGGNAKPDPDAMAVDGPSPETLSLKTSEAPLRSGFVKQGSEEEKARNELAAMRWLRAWYARSVEQLEKRIQGLEGASVAKQAQCRKVVALCCAVDESKVEDMLEDLVTAIESDGIDVDLARLAGFLDKVKRGGGAPSVAPAPSANPPTTTTAAAAASATAGAAQSVNATATADA